MENREKEKGCQPEETRHPLPRFLAPFPDLMTCIAQKRRRSD